MSETQNGDETQSNQSGKTARVGPFVDGSYKDMGNEVKVFRPKKLNQTEKRLNELVTIPPFKH